MTFFVDAIAFCILGPPHQQSVQSSPRQVILDTDAFDMLER